jgi:hypothetical protein
MDLLSNLSYLVCKKCWKWTFVPEEVYDFNNLPNTWEINMKRFCCSDTELTWLRATNITTSFVEVHDPDKIGSRLLEYEKYYLVSKVLALPPSFDPLTLPFRAKIPPQGPWTQRWL